MICIWALYKFEVATISAVENPWHALPAQAPFVLPQDVPYLPVDVADGDPGKLQLSVPPHPFAGCPERSRVLLLLLNPGFDGTDVTHYNDDPVYCGMLHGTFDFSNEPPMWCLDRRIAYTGAYKWLDTITRWLREECGEDALQHKLMQVQYLAFKSKEDPGIKQKLPSQNYSFMLVREAMAAGKEIVMMRSERQWIEAVPELADYSYIKLANNRRPYLSEVNLIENGFGRLCRALT
jgi:hypothetical protein